MAAFGTRAQSDEDEGEVALGARRVELRVGRLELAQDVVAQVDRVGEVLEAEAVLGEPGDRERARNGAEGEHELLVGDIERAEPVKSNETARS
ncbi:MAG: hypothetical protein H0W87_08735 [Actinobacteria bacterium]|nr:hypothetical protein [Actinomycetota bacterium]